MLVKAICQAFCTETCSETKRMSPMFVFHAVGERNRVWSTKNDTTTKPVRILSQVHVCFWVFLSAVTCLRVTHEYPEAKQNTGLRGKGLLRQGKGGSWLDNDCKIYCCSPDYSSFGLYAKVRYTLLLVILKCKKNSWQEDAKVIDSLKWWQHWLAWGSCLLLS